MLDQINAEALAEAQKNARKNISEVVAGESEEKSQAPRVGRTKKFQIRHETSDGSILIGEFTNKILTISDRIAIGGLMARMAGGVSYESLDPATRQLAEVVSHLQCSLKEKPSWFGDLLGEEDMVLIEKIWEEVASHEAMFREQQERS